jgi:hypothetical protein
MNREANVRIDRAAFLLAYCREETDKVSTHADLGSPGPKLEPQEIEAFLWSPSRGVRFPT